MNEDVKKLIEEAMDTLEEAIDNIETDDLSEHPVYKKLRKLIDELGCIE